MSRVIVGMSGGVDSAVAACLLKAAGMDVIGVTLRTWHGGENRCCRIDRARLTAEALGIPYHVYSCISEFEAYVTEPFVREYLRGRTPSPCVECNRHVKWEKLLACADLMGADYVATGHYAVIERSEDGRCTLLPAQDTAKDQSYMLCRLTQAQLRRTILPLGQLTKAEVRSIAGQLSLPSAQSPDSQELCFVTEGDYADFILERADCPEGNFVDCSGHVLGRHKGIIHYTVGQRKGLGITAQKPLYVNQIRAETNEVLLSDAASLLRTEIRCRDLHWMGMAPPEEETSFRAKVKIRYHHAGETGTVTVRDDAADVVFDSPVRAPAPGQAAVFYGDRGEILGCGTIQ